MAHNTVQPNIILINCDDLGYGDLGCYGSTANRTPHVDRLAAEGMRFTDFYMASPVCSPSRGAMLTGCYPRRIGFGTFDGSWVLFPGQGLGLNPHEKTVASILRDQGYATMIVGKWHCGDQPEFLPTQHGFDHYFGIPFSNDMGRQVGHRVDYPPLPLLRDDQVIQEQPDQAGITERYAEECVSFMRNSRNTPFFLYLAHMHVHLPLYAAEPFMKQSQNGRYGACVEAIDWVTGVIVNELQRLGIDDTTMIVFTSDNGSRGDNGGSNGPLRGTKGTTWEGGQRLPCIIRWPGTVPPGKVCHEIATSMDFLPTFANLAGTEPPRDRIIDGKDITDLITAADDATSPTEAVFYYLKDQLEAVRRGRWKLHVRKGDADVAELYDLQDDLAESVNLYAQNPDIVARLETLLQRCREDIGDSAHGMEGANCRPVGRVDAPDTLTHYDPSHPYICALYDLPQMG